jgi:zinc finger protein 830
MADIRSLLRNEQASRRITHPNLSYTKSGLLNCLVCHLIIKSETLWEGHLRSPNHKKNLLKAQNGGLEDVNETVSKKRKISDERDDVRKRKRSTDVEQEDIQRDGVRGPEEEQKPPTNNGLNDVAGPAIPDDESSSSSAALALPAKASAPVKPPRPEPQPQIDEDEWAAFEREVAPLAHQNPPAQSTDYPSATISAGPVSAAELAAQTNAERQQRRDAEVEDEKAEEETRLVEEFEVMEGLEERVKRLKEKREALRMGTGPIGDGTGEEDAEGKQEPPDRNDDDDDDEDDSDEVDEWGFA